MSVYSYISRNYASSHLCISGTLCVHIKGATHFFFLHTDLCTCEHAVFGLIQNSCCVEGSYHCFMAGSSGKNDTTLIPCGTEGVWSAGSSGSSGVVAVMSGTSQSSLLEARNSMKYEHDLFLQIANSYEFIAACLHTYVYTYVQKEWCPTFSRSTEIHQIHENKCP